VEYLQKIDCLSSKSFCRPIYNRREPDQSGRAPGAFFFTLNNSHKENIIFRFKPILSGKQHNWIRPSRRAKSLKTDQIKVSYEYFLHLEGLRAEACISYYWKDI